VSLRVNRGDYRQVVGIDAERNQVLIANAKGKVRAWNPSQAAVGKTAVFDVKDRAISVGDTLVWRYTDKQRFDKTSTSSAYPLSDCYAGMKLHVLGIDERQLHLTLECQFSTPIDNVYYATVFPCWVWSKFCLVRAGIISDLSLHS
jgi:hypothetical protein